MSSEVNHPEIYQEANKAATDPFIELFEIDLTSVGLGVVGFTTSFEKNGDPLFFNRRRYEPLPIKVTGFEYKGEGVAPRPKMSLSMINRITAPLIINNNDLLGCKVTRIRTFQRFLDNGDTPNPAARFQEDIYFISRRSKLSQFLVEFELSSLLDVEGQKLPRNKVIKNVCSYVYRYYKNGMFIYDEFYGCPYRGDRYFDINNKPCNIVEDKCNKQISGCEARYGYDTLPFQGFPGVSSK